MTYQSKSFEKSRVLFSNPPWWGERELFQDQNGKLAARCWSGARAGSRWPHTFAVSSAPDRFKFGNYLPYPFFMGYAATYLRNATGAEVRLRDSIALSESYRRYLEHLEEERYDYIFIESATTSWEHDAKLLSRIKAASPSTRIVLTGPVWVQAESILADYPVHAVIRGEYEKGAVKVLNGASGIVDFDLMTQEEMNAAPFPYYDDAMALRYFDCNPKGMLFPHLQVWSSRGCPFKCIFCVWPSTMTGNDPDGSGHRTVRHYSGDYMEAFLTEMTRRYPYRSVYFDDDTFNLGNRHVREMCAVMRKVGLPWSAMCRSDTISREVWKEMKESGCFGVKIGFESGNQYVVDSIVNKHIDLEKAREVVHYIKSLGMTVHGTFTYGLPGETKDQMADTRRYIASLPLDTYQESGCAEIDGTPLHHVATHGESEVYPGARMSDGYRKEVDGGKKWRDMIAQMSKE